MVRLWILGLLMKRPMHGYEIKQYLEITRSDQWAGILPGSIYHAIKRMESEGLIEQLALERAGNRTRAVYTITPAGKEEFKRLLAEAWRTPSRTLPSTLYTAITFLDGMPPEEALPAIDQQIAALEQALAEWDEAEAIKARYGDPAGIQAPMFQNGREHFLADLKLLRAIRERLPRLPQVIWQVPPMEEWSHGEGATGASPVADAPPRDTKGPANKEESQ